MIVILYMDTFLIPTFIILESICLYYYKEMKINEVVKSIATYTQALHNRIKGCNQDRKITTKFGCSDNIRSAPVFFLNENQTISIY